MAVEMTEGRAAGLCALTAVLLCLPVLRGGFVMDDAYLIVDNPAIRQLGNVPGFFTQPWGGGTGGAEHAGVNAAYYRPLTTSLYAVEHAIFGLRPWGFHLVSIFLHAAATALVAALAMQLLERAGALVAGLLFAVHPVHTEAIAAACYQTTLLAGVLASLALWSLGRAMQCDGRAKRWLVLAAVATLLAGLAKEEGAVVPLLGAAWVVLAPRSSRRRTLALGVGGMVLAAALVVALRAAIVTGSSQTYFAGADRATVVLTMVRVVALDVELLCAPLRLCPFYDWFIITPSSELSFDVARGALLSLALLAGIVAARRRAPVAAIGLAWIALGLLPVLHFVPILNVAGERFLYLPSVGLVLVAGWLFQQAQRRRRRLSLVVAAVVLCLFAARTLVRWPQWRDDRTLNEATAIAYPQTPTPHLNLAKLALAAKDRAGALRHLEAAQRCAPDWPVPRRLADAIRAEHGSP